MITIQSAVEEIVSKSPHLESALAAGIVNSSALTRQIRKEIEKRLFKDVNEGAVIVAINRLAMSLRKKRSDIKPFTVSLNDLAVKSNLIEFTFVNSPNLIIKQRELLEKIGAQKGSFLTLTQTLYQTTLIANSVFEKEVRKIFKGETLLSNLTKLSAITLTLSEETVKTPGVYNFVLNKLAWFGINVIEVVSSFTELNLIVEDTEVDRAFSVLKNLDS